MASSRYSRSSSRRGQPAKPAKEEDVSVELPEENATFAEEAYQQDESGSGSGSGDSPSQSSGSRRVGRNSGAGRSSRRMAATSGKKSSRKPALSPEEAAARRRALMGAIKLALGLIVLVGGGFAVWWFLLRDDPRTRQAQAVVSKIRHEDLTRIDAYLEHQQPQEAEAAIAEARKLIETTEAFTDPKIAPLAQDPKDELAKRDDRLARVKRDVKVQQNLTALRAQFEKLTEPETDLETLQKDAQSFLDNPVEWKAGGHNEDYIKTYSTEVNSIQVRMASIDSERTRRKDEKTTTPVQNARDAAKGLVEQEKFHEALALIDDAARKFPEANFADLRSWVEDSAQKDWAAAKSVVENLYKDYEAIGSSAATRKEAIDKARARLHQVIDNFGIDQYVDEAKQMLAKYPE
jgi:hypothetical protein